MRIRVLSLQLAVVAILAGLWQLLAIHGTLPDIYVSRPTRIIAATWDGFANGTLTSGLGDTLYETVVGFAIASVLGVLGGMALYESSLLERVSRPFLTAANNMPRLALASLFVLWLGVGTWAHVALIVTMSFFVVLLNTYAGFSSCDRDYLLLAKVLGASRRKLFRSFLFPQAVPAIFVGLQLGLTYSFMGAVIGEIITGGSGLGALISTYASTYDSAGVFADLLVIAIVATVLSALIRAIESRLLGWRKHELRGLVPSLLGDTLMRRLIIAAAAASMLVLIAACGSSSSSDVGGSGGSGPISVSVINYPGSDASWLAYIAQQKGFFKANDLNVSFVSLQAGPQAMAALVGGSADIGVLDTDNMAPLLAKGQKYTLLINTVTNFWAVVGSKSLAGKSLSQVVQALKGQSVSAPSVGGTGGRQLGAIFAAYGLPASSVKLVADPTNVSLTAGRVQAAITDTIGACRLTTLGYPEIMNFVDPPQPTSSYPAAVQSLIGLPGLGYWSKSSWAAANPSAVSHFQKAIEQATAWAKNPSNTSAEDSLLRSSPFNLATMTSSQWATCVSRVTAAFNNSYTSADALVWQHFVTSEGVASSLPPSSQWLAAGIPQS